MRGMTKIIGIKVIIEDKKGKEIFFERTKKEPIIRFGEGLSTLLKVDTMDHIRHTTIIYEEQSIESYTLQNREVICTKHYSHRKGQGKARHGKTNKQRNQNCLIQKYKSDEWNDRVRTLTNKN